MLLVFSARRAFCLKGVLNHLTRVSSICLLTSKNTHTHIFFIETSKPKGGDHRTCWPTNSRWDPYDGDDVAVRHFHFDHYAACVCVCLSEHPYVSLCFMHTAIIKAGSDWPTFRQVFCFIQAWSRGLLVWVCNVFSVILSDPPGPHKLQTGIKFWIAFW